MLLPMLRHHRWLDEAADDVTDELWLFVALSDLHSTVNCCQYFH